MLHLDSWPHTPHSVLIVILLLGFTGTATSQDLKVIQPEKSVSVAAGDSVTLNCSVTTLLPVGPIKWFKGRGQNRHLIYVFTGEKVPRITSVADTTKRNNLDFSIRISKVTPGDAGTYYCVKFLRSESIKELHSGGGTDLYVLAKPSSPVVFGPVSRVTPEKTVSYTCKSHGFFPRTITLKWFKNGNELSDFQTTVDPQKESVSYNISSTAWVELSSGDVYSQIICEVAHITLQGGPLRGTAKVSDTIRVLPTLEISQKPSMEANQINVTCQVNKFYPSGFRLTWLENGNVSRIEQPSTLTVNKDGTYNWTSWLSVNICTHEENVVLTCQVEHDGQPATIKEHIVVVKEHQRKQESKTSDTAQVLVAVFLGPKLLLATGVSAVYMYKKQKA